MSRYTRATIQLLRSAGIDVRKKPPRLIRSAHELTMTVEFVAAHFAVYRAGTDVVMCQVGAYDGSANDPVAESLKRYGWRGILVEPQPKPFEALKALHLENSRVQVFNIAISDSDGSRPLFTLEPAADLPNWTEQLSSFNRSHIVKYQKDFPDIDMNERLKSIDVTTWTFDTLLRHAGVRQVDVLQIDAEGYDYELLQLFDVPRRLPTIINYEHVHLSRADLRAAADLLIKCNYQLAMTAVGDTIAYRKPPGPSTLSVPAEAIRQ